MRRVRSPGQDETARAALHTALAPAAPRAGLDVAARAAGSQPGVRCTQAPALRVGGPGAAGTRHRLPVRA